MKQNKIDTASGLSLTLNAIALAKENVDYKGDENVIKLNKTYACHFGKANMNGEIVTKDSFDDGFAAMKETGGGIMPSINWQHDPNCIIGTWTDLTPDDTGLMVEGYIAKKQWDVQNRILPLIEAGVPLYLSTEGFVGWDDMIVDNETGIYTAKRFLLVRISLVDVPADFQQDAIITNAIELHRKNAMRDEKTEKPMLIHPII